MTQQSWLEKSTEYICKSFILCTFIAIRFKNMQVTESVNIERARKGKSREILHLVMLESCQADAEGYKVKDFGIEQEIVTNCKWGLSKGILKLSNEVKERSRLSYAYSNLRPKF